MLFAKARSSPLSICGPESGCWSLLVVAASTAFAPDRLSQRWVQTERVYDRENPKRIYYLSMEFLIGRSLGNNVINLLLDRLVQRAAQQRDLDWLGLLEQEPDAGLGNGGLGRLAACFLDT